MRGDGLARLCLFVLLGSLMIRGSVSLAQPPGLDIPDSAVARGLGPAQIAQIDKQLGYWRNRIIKATDVDQVTKARSGIKKDYRLHMNTAYQYPFAGRAAEILTPLLKDTLRPDDKLMRLKEVNVAVALSEMPQVTIQPALETMVRHKNPAVRYRGWIGYVDTRKLILAQGSNFVPTMLATLRNSAAKETSAPVIGAILEMTDVKPSTGTVPRAVARDAQRQAFEILRANWSRWCKRLLAREPEMAMMLRKGVKAMETLSRSVAADQAGKGEVLQLLVDLIRYSAQTYDDAGGEGAVAHANNALLRQGEAALRTISGKTDNRLAKALDSKETPRGAIVRTAVLDWVTDLKDFGVVAPKVVYPATQPTTQPAAPPAP